MKRLIALVFLAAMLAMGCGGEERIDDSKPDAAVCGVCVTVEEDAGLCEALFPCSEDPVDDRCGGSGPCVYSLPDCRSNYPDCEDQNP